MPLLIERRIKEGKANVNRHYCLPLLHFSVIGFDGGDRGLRPEMTKLLLEHSADASRMCHISYADGRGKAIDSLGFLVHDCLEFRDQLDGDTDFLLQIVELLLQKGANPNGKLRERNWLEWNLGDRPNGTPLVLAVVELGLLSYHLIVTLKAFITRGANPNARDAKYKTLLDTVFTDGVAFRLDDWLWLLDHGAKINGCMAELLYNPYRSLYSEHVLLKTACRKTRYYNSNGRHVAQSYNPSWSMVFFPFGLHSLLEIWIT